MSISFRVSALCLAILLPAICATGVHAIDYDESIQGDLSDNPAAPTPLGTLSIGSHSLQASFVDEDYDLATFTIAPGTRLDSIVLDRYGGSTFSFSGLQAGSDWTAGLGYNVDPAPLLGWVLFGEDMIGTDILDDYALGTDTIGFTLPLPPGAYTLELQETGSIIASAEFTLNVVPEPSALGIALIGIAALIAHRQRRRINRQVRRPCA